MFGSHGANVGPGSTCAALYSVAGTSACLTTGFAADTHSLVFGPIPAGGVPISNLSVATSVALTGGTGAVVTVLDNGTATALKCTVATGGTSCTDNTDTATIPAGDFLEVQIVPSSGSSAVAYQVAFKY
jgi:hypothetical protein